MSAPSTPLLDPARWQRHLFRGRWEETAHGTTVIEPATGAALTEVGLAGADDVAISVQAAPNSSPALTSGFVEAIFHQTWDDTDQATVHIIRSGFAFKEGSSFSHEKYALGAQSQKRGTLHVMDQHGNVLMVKVATQLNKYELALLPGTVITMTRFTPIIFQLGADTEEADEDNFPLQACILLQARTAF